MKSAKVFFFICSFSYLSSYHADAQDKISFKKDNNLSITKVLESSARFYPEIQEALQNIRVKEAEIDSAEGVFDTNLNQLVYARPSGYYDGMISDTRIEKPLREMNTKIFTGYRRANGNFPIYEDMYQTNNSGEYYMGVKLSLLRDREINDKLFKISASELKRDEANVKLLSTQLKTQEDAMKAYWTWVIQGHAYFVYKHLLDLAEVRQTKLKRRVENGDLAAIYLQENTQYILKRKGQLNKARMHLQEAAFNLSLYYRDEKGNPLVPSGDMLPSMIDEPHENDFGDSSLIARLRNRPEFALIDNYYKITNQERRLAENNMLPNTDLEVKFSKDFGGGSVTRGSNELTTLLNFSIPFNRSVAKADIARADAFLAQLSYQERMQLDKLSTYLNQIIIRLDNLYEYYDLAVKETKLAEKMSNAEETRFVNGMSDFFTLNQREEQIAKAQLRQLKSQENYLKTQAQLYALTADFTKLKISPPVN